MTGRTPRLTSYGKSHSIHKTMPMPAIISLETSRTAFLGLRQTQSIIYVYAVVGQGAEMISSKCVVSLIAKFNFDLDDWRLVP